MAKKLNERSVLQIASEALPFAKTGGLADVLGALPPALARLGWDVTVVTPRYRGVTAGSLVERFPVTVGGFVADAGFFEAPLPDYDQNIAAAGAEADQVEWAEHVEEFRRVRLALDMHVSALWQPSG